MITRIVLALTILATAAFLLPGAASACSCMPPPPPEKAAEEADAVFVGVATSIDTSFTEGIGWVRVSFDVTASVKGGGEKATVWTADNSAACGVYFEEGQRYLVYASHSGERLTTNLCTRTARYEDAGEDLEALSFVGAGRRSSCGGPTNAGMMQAAFLTLCGLVLIGWRSRR